MMAAARSGVPKIAIVITDGASSDQDRTLREARFAKQTGITLFAIGVGRQINKAELEEMATNEKYVFEVKDYSELLEKLIDELPEAACEVTTTTTTTIATTTLPQMIPGCEEGTKPLDIIFATPDEAGIRDTEVALAFIQDVVDGFYIGERRVQVGLTPRLCGDKGSISLNEHDNKAVLLDAIRNRGLQSTLLSLQLAYLLEEGFTARAGDRPGVQGKDVAVLIVDNQASDPATVQLLAEEAKDDGIRLIVIGVGGYVDRTLVEGIASSPAHTFFVNDYGHLMSLTQRLHDLLCSEASQ